MALHRGQELWQFRHPRDQALHVFLSWPCRHFDIQDAMMRRERQLEV